MTATITGNGIDKVQDGSIQAADLASGVPSRSQLPAGTVLQVVQATTTAVNQTTSSTMTNSGFSASITPTSASSKILVLLSGPIYSDATNCEPNIAIYRNGTSVTGTAWLSDSFNSAGRLIDTLGIHYLDSPASTSSVTYAVYFNIIGGGYVAFPVNGRTATLILMEIAA